MLPKYPKNSVGGLYGKLYCIVLYRRLRRRRGQRFSLVYFCIFFANCEGNLTHVQLTKRRAPKCQKQMPPPPSFLLVGSWIEIFNKTKKGLVLYCRLRRRLGQRFFLVYFCSFLPTVKGKRLIFNWRKKRTRKC